MILAEEKQLLSWAPENPRCIGMGKEEYRRDVIQWKKETLEKSGVINFWLKINIFYTSGQGGATSLRVKCWLSTTYVTQT
jgi:hypothetical protein